ncbi:MAG: dihydrodipicolinate synthase family protein [Bacteroidetes Order II. Incertae sedis bacterium]|jgi:4-hydroxy-tetrahydrodipicolinate synthase|nr:dihydrodipicolinate synthase family protein [Bacteroidetes Order II. bacterium]MBT4603400.1 dihydrodipicolinate synthase family protein [Bacteroidetes Order II. bacterium]MBT5250421.1 dihydrodipicolinate synthase family protein [Bacteroidetes Order II. bacterium]MBT6201400.1 dihydrodipicolinate synthase family protein [Bacteroidetes Order II. bacterium]MBT6423767.1 dihydrodipicolinate synthase family protein [Bacteroidetes Order II. bacterium]
MSILQGIWAATVTPLKSDLNVDSSRLVAHIEWLFDQGSHGVVVFGTTGEANSFSVRERRSVIEQLHERGVDMNRIMVGTGCTAVPDTVELSQHAVDAGCAAVLMLPPFYYKTVSEDGLFDFISSSVDQIDRSTTRVILYHFPKMAGIGFSVPLINRLKEAHGERIAGIKDSSGDTDNLTNYCRDIEDFAVFAGSEALLPYALSEGGVGCVSATANVTSRLARAVFDGAKAEAERMIKTRKALEALPFVPTMKHLLAENSSQSDFNLVRPPLRQLTAAQLSRLDEILGSTGVLPNFIDA